MKVVALSSVLSEQPRNGWSPPAQFQTNSGVPVLTLSSVTGFKYKGTKVKLSSAPTREDAHYWLREGELLITRSNTQELVGHAAIYDGTPSRAICCDLIMKMRVDPAKADRRFIHYYLQSEGARAYLTSRAQGASSTMKKIGKQVVQNLPVPFLPLHEQQRIVAILDEAFEAIATAKANTEKNLQNARALFESQLQSVFTQRCESWVTSAIGQCIRFIDYRGKTPVKTASGIRLITAKNVKMGVLQETPEEFIAPEAYDGWMTRGFPRRGDVLFTTEAPLANVAQLDTAEKVAFAQRIIIMQPDVTKLDSTFLKYLLLSAPVQARIKAQGTGATVKGIKASLLKLIEISFPADLGLQRGIVAKLDLIQAETQRLAAIYTRKLAALDELKKSLLQQAFTGQLTANFRETVSIPFPAELPGISITDLHAGILAMAYRAHERGNKLDRLTKVKVEKISHMIEAWAGIELGRKPVKDYFGPNDTKHLKGVEHRAKMTKSFSFQKDSDGGERIRKLANFDALLAKTETALGERQQAVEELLTLMLPMSYQQAEVFTTVHAAWNNLLLTGQEATDEAIVTEARENWHPEKLKIERDKFFRAIEWIREKNLVPQGKGKLVGTKSAA